MPLLKAMIFQKETFGFYFPIVVMFNPPSLKIKRVTRYSNLATLSADPEKKQFIKPENDTLTVDLFYDTTDCSITFNNDANYGVNVRAFVQPILDLAKVPKGKTEPPRIIFAWGDLIFPGFIASIDQTYDYFHTLGWAQRATLSLTIVQCTFDPEGLPDPDEKAKKGG